MMTPKEERKILDGMTETVKKRMDEAHALLLKKITDGEDPRDAVQQVMGTFIGRYASSLQKSFTAILGQSVGSADVLKMEVSGVSLSRRLYKEAQDTSKIVAGIVSRHARGFVDARELAIKIYEGYGRGGALNLSPGNKALPKFLRDELLTDPSILGAMQRTFARIQAGGIKTPALKAAYLDYLKAIESGAGEELLAKKLNIAFNEKMRYFSNRIAQTELHRSYATSQAREIMDDQDIKFVQYRMSGTHPRTDICDLWAKQDAFGLGPGVYPKEECPVAPCHPFCRCFISPRLDIPEGTKYKRDPEAHLRFLRTMTDREAAMVMGSKDRLRLVNSGAEPMAVWNRGSDDAYRVRKAGEVYKDEVVGIGIKSMEKPYRNAWNGDETVEG